MPNKGAVTQALAINGSYSIPAGYHNGLGAVNQSITTKAAATFNPSTAAQTIAANQYLNGVQTIAATTGSANLAQVLSGYTFNSGNGIGLTGNIPSKVAATITPTTYNQTIAAAQYLSGIQTILGDANLIASNIRAGLSIFGVTGSVTPTSYQTANGVTATTNEYGTLTSSVYRHANLGSIGFTPKLIIGTITLNGYSGTLIYAQGGTSTPAQFHNYLNGSNAYFSYTVPNFSLIRVGVLSSSSTTFTNLTWWAYTW